MLSLSVIALLAAPGGAQSTLPFLSPIFGSHMVLQRDRPNVFWGWTKPGERVTVQIADHRASGRAGSDGKWVVHIAPPPAGGPYTVSIEDGPQSTRLEDVLVGDVWVCSGQSNMEFGIGMTRNSQAEIASANYPGMRLFMVQHATSLSPVKTPMGSWAVCSPQTIAQGGWNGFSAVAYFFGRELHQRLQIPIGLVDTCWGGTVAESWTSEQGLRPLKDFNSTLDSIDKMTQPGAANAEQLLDDWYKLNDPGSHSDASWAAEHYDDSSWKPSEPSTKYEDLGLDKFDGVVWFRKEITLPDPLPSGDALLQLGTVDDMDTTWVNGSEVGESHSVTDWRQYHVPASLLKPGKNVIAVRVLDTGGIGGMTTPENQILYYGGQQISISGGWKYAPGIELSKASSLPKIFNGDPNVPTVLNNGMIQPIVPLAIKGAIWYQGESNVGRAAQYQKLLPAMIGDWRHSWGQGDFPFYIVQIANFGDRHAQPVDDPWADLREAQTLTANRVHNSGLAVTIDIGEGGDIHPKDKQDVGYRLALQALHGTYGQDISYSGPTYRAMSREGKVIRVSFDHTDGGLEFKGTTLAGFQIAGKDHQYRWADARIDGNSVIVSSPSVPQPTEVRYAWDANPEAGLYNGAGLPAVPFRTANP